MLALKRCFCRGLDRQSRCDQRQMIGANEHESHYIFDLLMSNTSDIIPDVLSTDTHGVNHVNFALLDLFGYQFAPLCQLAVINDMFDVKEDKTPNSAVLKANQYPSYCAALGYHQRIAVSLKQRKTTQATLVRKLGVQAQSPAAGSLTEYNRLVKAYLLCYIDDASLRNYVQRALNREGLSPTASGREQRQWGSVRAVQTKKSSYGMSALAWSPMPSFTSTPGYSASC
ncbi:Tn3 family transposase [Enterobacter hormaechei]|uniref:Tn3 family transposase n=1 Tax=Enterobacter hormaechei TaxID=158836 RepID=UPI002948FA79|nr:Tn3 family transposase [Enterobacter hormaechei]MDV5717569.1 Tn3 family transposase [Enterobacter hormaechei]